VGDIETSVTLTKMLLCQCHRAHLDRTISISNVDWLQLLPRQISCVTEHWRADPYPTTLFIPRGLQKPIKISYLSKTFVWYVHGVDLIRR